MKLPRISGALLAVSIGINFLFAATDAESPAGVGSAGHDERPRDVSLQPAHGVCRAVVLPGARMADPEPADRGEARASRRTELTAAGVNPEAQKPMLDKLEADMRQSIVEGSDDPLDLGELRRAGLGEPDRHLRGGILQFVRCGIAAGALEFLQRGRVLVPGEPVERGALAGLGGIARRRAGVGGGARAGRGGGAALAAFDDGLPAGGNRRGLRLAGFHGADREAGSSRAREASAALQLRDPSRLLVSSASVSSVIGIRRERASWYRTDTRKRLIFGV